MIDGMANHAARVRRHMARHGQDAVEDFIDTCLSLENLIDPMSPFIVRSARPKRRRGRGRRRARRGPAGCAPRATWTRSSTRPSSSRRRRRRREDEKKRQKRRFPEQPQRDVLRVPARARAARALAARRARDRARRGLLLRAAGADEDHERGLGHLLALEDHDREGADAPPRSSTTPTPARACWRRRRAGSTRTSSASSCSATSRSAGTRASSARSGTSALDGAEARDGFDGEIHMSGDDHQRQPDRHDAEHARRFDDVGKDAELEIIGHECREDRQHEQQHEPDEIVQNKLEDASRPSVHEVFRLDGPPVG